MQLFSLFFHSFVLNFTSGDTGIAVSKKAGMIPLLEKLAGKDACIVLEDADLDLGATNIIKGGFSYRRKDSFFLLNLGEQKCLLTL